MACSTWSLGRVSRIRNLCLRRNRVEALATAYAETTGSLGMMFILIMLASEYCTALSLYVGMLRSGADLGGLRLTLPYFAT